jgi:hypothetical protein
MSRARHRSGRRIAGFTAVLATLVASALATTAQGDAHASTGAPVAPAVARSARTTLRLDVAGCSRCHVQLQHAINGVEHVWTSHPQRVGSDHVAVFHLRTALTHGLSVTIWAPWEGDIDAVLNVVTRYAGHDVGSRVTRADARAAKRAEGCWAGTSQSEATLHFRVVRIPSRTVTGARTHVPLTFATHSLASWKPMVKDYGGTIGNQDAFYCTQPKA